MIRINLLPPDARRPQTTLIRRRELWTSLMLLATGGGALFFLSSRSSPPPQPAPAPAPPAAAPQVEPPAPLPAIFEISNLTLRRESNSVVVVVTVDPRVKYLVSQLNDPNRIVIDFPDTRLAVPSGRHFLRAERPQLDRVRASQFQAEPPIARLVLDVPSIQRYHVRPDPAGVEIRVGDVNP